MSEEPSTQTHQYIYILTVWILKYRHVTEMNQIREIFLRRAAESSSRPRSDQWAFTQPVHESEPGRRVHGGSEVKGHSLLFEQLSVGGDGGGNVRPLCCCSSPLTRPPGRTASWNVLRSTVSSHCNPLTSDFCWLRALLLMETHGFHLWSKKTHKRTSTLKSSTAVWGTAASPPREHPQPVCVSLKQLLCFSFVILRENVVCEKLSGVVV